MRFFCYDVKSSFTRPKDVPRVRSELTRRAISLKLLDDGARTKQGKRGKKEGNRALKVFRVAVL